MSVSPQSAMVLAAGLGLRMRPLSLEKPKPLLEIGNQPMLDHVIDRLQEAGVKKLVINTHYRAEMIEAHLARRNAPLSPNRWKGECILSHESALLDTGGGVKKALPHLGEDPVYVVNADLPWRDGEVPALKRLAAAFDPARMDALLLVAPLSGPHLHGFDGAEGDFFMEGEGSLGRLRRAGTAPPRPFVFISAQIIKPRLFAGWDEDVFSTRLVWEKAEKQGRLFGLRHHGSCYHVGTPQDLAEANRLLRTGQGW